MALRLAGYCPHTGPNGQNCRGSLGNKTAVSGVDRVLKDRRQMVARRQRYDRRAMVSEEIVWSAKEGTDVASALQRDAASTFWQLHSPYLRDLD
jgi:hypothetical protein